MTVGDRQVTESELKRDVNRITMEMGVQDQEIKTVIKPLINNIIDNYLIFEYGKVNGITLSEMELNDAVNDLKSDYPEKTFLAMLLQKTIDFEEWKEALKEQLLLKKIIAKASSKISPVTFHEIKSYFESHRDEYRYDDMVKIRQIVTRSREKAEKIHDLLAKGTAMDELAKQSSITPEAKNGGEIGWISRDELGGSMEKVFFSLPVGKTSSIVKTPYGYHIIRVMANRPGGPKTLREASVEIESKLFQDKEETFYREWLKELRAIFPVRVSQQIYQTLEWS